MVLHAYFQITPARQSTVCLYLFGAEDPFMLNILIALLISKHRNTQKYKQLLSSFEMKSINWHRIEKLILIQLHIHFWCL